MILRQRRHVVDQVGPDRTALVPQWRDGMGREEQLIIGIHAGTLLHLARIPGAIWPHCRSHPRPVTTVLWYHIASASAFVPPYVWRNNACRAPRTTAGGKKQLAISIERLAVSSWP